MKLFGSTLSANYRKASAISSHLAIDVEEVAVNIYRGEGKSDKFLSKNNLGQIPILIDRDLILLESNAIIVYLSDSVPINKLYPKTKHERAKVHQWLFWESSQWQPVLSKTMAQQVGHLLMPSIIPKPIPSTNWEEGSTVRQLNHLENNLSQTWILGAELTIADFSVGAMTTYFNACNFPWESYPNISRWHSQLNTLHSWKKTKHPLWV